VLEEFRAFSFTVLFWWGWQEASSFMSYDTLRCIRYPIDPRFFFAMSRSLALVLHCLGRDFCACIIGFRVYSVLYNTFSLPLAGSRSWDGFFFLLACLLGSY